MTRLIRRTVVALTLLMATSACGDDEAIFQRASDTTTADSFIVAETPFEQVVRVVLNLPEDDVFALLDALGDDDYFALLDYAVVDGDAEFVEQMDFDTASYLVDLLDTDLFDQLLALAGGGSAGAPTTVATGAAGDETELGGGGTISSAAADVRQIDGGPLGSGGTIEVEIGPGDISFLAYARTSDPEANVFVTGVTSPSGTDVGDEIGLEYGELSNFGEAVFYAPLVEEADLEVGVYSIEFEATGDITTSGAFVRSGASDGLQAFDVVFWMATNEQYDTDALEREFRQAAANVFGPQGITVGAMTFIVPPQAIIDQYAVLDFTGETDSDLRGLCRAMSSSVGPLRALNFAIVDRLDGGGEDAVIEGSSAGLPGTVLLTDSSLSCVAGMASSDPNEPGRDLIDRAVVVWHEAGHHLGLYHTSEQDGQYFDLISDTPECPITRDDNNDGIVDLYECADLDADNFMFYDGDGSYMSDGQAWSVRRHPLLYPVSG